MRRLHDRLVDAEIKYNHARTTISVSEAARRDAEKALKDERSAYGARADLARERERQWEDDMTRVRNERDEAKLALERAQVNAHGWEVTARRAESMLAWIIQREHDLVADIADKEGR
jgi:multidrug resistance efflux pump